MDDTERDGERGGTQASGEAVKGGPGARARVSRAEFLKLAGAATAGLALVYGFLYVVLQLQDYSLLLGTAGLFLLLAAIMIATRKMDWYARDAASHSERT